MKIIKENWKYYLTIIIVASIVCIPLLNENLNIAIDDGIQHICRLIGTKQAIEQGTGVIMANFCNGFGYSWSIFYSPLTAYIPMIFALFTNSYVVMLKLFMYIVSIATGITMYRFMRTLTKNKNVAIIASATYILVPYRLTDMYIRVAIAELTSFIFLPLIFLGTYKILQRKNDKLLNFDFIIGTAGLLLTHTVITLYTAIFCIVYVLVQCISQIILEKDKSKNTRYLKVIFTQFIINAIIVLILTSFYTIPMLMHKYSANYEVFKEGRMLRLDALIENKVNASNLFFDNSYMIYCLGIGTILGMIITPFTYKKIQEEKYRNLYNFSLISGLISIIMSLDIFPFEKLPSILTMLQFSFRMLEFSAFFLCIVVAINAEKIIKKLKITDALIITVILVLSIIPLKRHLTYSKINEERLIEGVRVTSKTGRVHAGCASFEYLPSKAFENRSYIETRENKVYVIKGKVDITNEEKNNTNLKFDIENIEDGTVLELPYIYYLGYQVKLKKEDGENILLKTEESDKGFVQVKVPNIKKGKVDVSYKGCINLEFMLKYKGK